MRATAQAWPRAIHRGRRHSPPCAWRVAARPPPPCAAASAMDRYPAARRHGDPAPGPALAAGAAEGPPFSHIRFFPCPRASSASLRREGAVDTKEGGGGGASRLPRVRRSRAFAAGRGLWNAASAWSEPRLELAAGTVPDPCGKGGPPRPPHRPRGRRLLHVPTSPARPPARRNPYSAPAQPASGSGRPSGPRPGNFPGPSPAAPSRIRQLDPAARPVGRRPGCARGRCRRPGRGGAPVEPHASTAAGGGPPRRSAAPRRRRRSAGRRVSPPR